jgi:hypothetical protein
MSEMIERVARALCKADGVDRCIYPDCGCPHEYRARAAIEALREPTPAMIEAGIQCGDGYGSQPGTWQAMIDQALKEGEG